MSAILLLCLALPAQSAQDLRLATTTSTENSGLLAAILPQFEKQYQTRVRVISVGSGKAMKLGENGDVDVVLVHSRADEDRFVAAGFGVGRRDVMYNDFILAGPGADPAGARGTDVLAAFKRIAASGSRFVSRGDDSGTDKTEKSYWRDAGIDLATLPGYLSAGLGMGEVLMMAAELRGYTLTDRATYATYRARTGLEVLVSGDAKLFNPYGVIAVNPQRHPGVNHWGAMQFIDWLTSTEGQEAIADFRVGGQQLFFPNAR
ncbi:MAG: substrate-binding domain-containing protein [Gammaproteobacteria bacterium]|nr:substrate-binding domain-containing protein [Gammaproteobacteria bacterium]